MRAGEGGGGCDFWGGGGEGEVEGVDVGGVDGETGVVVGVVGWGNGIGGYAHQSRGYRHEESDRKERMHGALFVPI